MRNWLGQIPAERGQSPLVDGIVDYQALPRIDEAISKPKTQALHCNLTHYLLI